MSAPEVGVGNGGADLLTVAEVAAALRVSRMTVYRLVEVGELQAFRIGHSIRIDRAALDGYLARCSVERVAP